MTQEELRKVQMLQLEMAKEVKRICEKHQIQYFLDAGSMLGAVRHKGFIPWDDDLDIGFLREDYNRFIEVCKIDLPDSLFLQTWDTDEHYGLPFAKVMLKETLYKQIECGTSKAADMIFVDLFPYDNMSSNIIKRKCQFYFGKTAEKLLLYKQGYAVWIYSKHRFLHRILSLTSHLFTKEILKKIVYNMQTMENNVKTAQVINLNGAYRDKEYMEFNGTKTKKMMFEGYEFNIPLGWEQLLKNMYGDYMKLPPENEQVNKHKATIIDMGRYQILNSATR